MHKYVHLHTYKKMSGRLILMAFYFTMSKKCCTFAVENN